MAPRISGDRWRRASPHLDRALELSAGEREHWLEALRGEDAAAAADVEALLVLHGVVRERGFLETAAVASRAAPTLAGHVVGAYTLRRQIGQGGMGNVWLGERNDGRFTGVAAVKLLNASLLGDAAANRFAREATLLARLRHPHIAQLLDAGVSSLGYPYIVLEHVDGVPIDRYCDERMLGVEARLRLFLHVVEAVAHAHANLVVHRDLKPSNVLVTADGQVKLLDFGIAKLLDPQSEETFTRDGAAALTPEFAAPEQFTGAEVTTATDVYALGVLLYVLLTGAHPAAGAGRSPAGMLRAILDDEPARPSLAVATAAPDVTEEVAGRRATTPRRLRAALAGDLDTIVGKTLRKLPQERYESVGELAEDLRRHLGHRPIAAREVSLAYRAAKLVRRNRLAATSAALAVAALLAGLAGTLVEARHARQRAAEAMRERARADRQAAEARAQRDFALRQLSRAEAINDLNTFLLSEAGTTTRPFTVGELLQRAEQIARRQRGETLDNRVEALIAIGRDYQLHDQHDRARDVLATAYASAGETATAGAARARAACALASAVALGGDGDRAERLLAEADRLLPGRPELVLDRVFCAMRGSEVAQERGEVTRGLARAELAQRLARDSPVASAALDLGIAMRLAESYRLAGRLAEAATAFASAHRELVALGRDETETAGTLLNNWALTVATSGQPLAAERLYRQAIALSSRQGGAQGVSPMLLNNLARTLRGLHRLPEARVLADRAIAKARSSGQEVALNQSLLVGTAVYRQLGDLGRARAMLAEVEPRLQRMLPPEHIAFAGLARERSQLALAAGDRTTALREAERAVAIIEGSPEGPPVLPRALLDLAEVELELGDGDHARGDAERALRLQRARPEGGLNSSIMGAIHLTLARVHVAQGRPAAAREAALVALRQLESAVGAEHPSTREARELARSLSPAG